MSQALVAEIRQTELAIARAKALLTTLWGCSPDGVTQALISSAEHAIAALTERLSALRYRYRHGATEAEA